MNCIYCHIKLIDHNYLAFTCRTCNVKYFVHNYSKHGNIVFIQFKLSAGRTVQIDVKKPAVYFLTPKSTNSFDLMWLFPSNVTGKFDSWQKLQLFK